MAITPESIALLRKLFDPNYQGWKTTKSPDGKYILSTVSFEMAVTDDKAAADLIVGALNTIKELIEENARLKAALPDPIRGN